MQQDPLASRAPGAIDFAAAWRVWLEAAADPRLDVTADLDFWERAAEECDAWHQPFEHTLAVIAARIEPGESLLDVGAGIGRFALPLAARCGQVTALDQSAAVLSVLEQNARAASIGNIQTLCATWEDAAVERHDVVLAAWSLYRELDLEACLRKLIEATGRLLIVIAPDADATQRERGETAAYLYILGALRDLGARAELTIVLEPQPGDAAPTPVPVITWERPQPAT
jgi:SAM-dependent methyltransferase